ncbi:MAG: carboxypeptidase-like regulatory domain-containing protein, partial [bacterium]|nr:carboxypeptidase-like regulatory domain-containing protein [bacterium]
MKKAYLKLLVLSVLLVFAMGQLGGCLSCVTESGSISGNVVDATTGSPISGATVRVGSISTTTGTNGNYKLQNVPAGVQTVTAEKSGYISDSQQVLVVGGQETTNVNFALSPT